MRFLLGTAEKETLASTRETAIIADRVFGIVVLNMDTIKRIELGDGCNKESKRPNQWLTIM
jgi:hypothetical protein